MNSYKYLPITILLFFILKYLLTFLENKVSSINNKIELFKIENGMLSINDLQKDNYTRFIDTVKLYLLTHGYENIKIFPQSTWQLTNIQGSLNKEKVLISCIQNLKFDNDKDNGDNWQLTSKIDIQCLLARMYENNCKKGLLINNSTFTKDAIDFGDNYNIKKSQFEIKIVDGYELTRATRNYKNFIAKET
jgi:hypothetical protein